ncbi:hypothetical protein pipiens_020032 [Culex pipiens pipiens]|uniref:Uncharacterized protein n=1 Tax=Culex pipiens pipiens TaxID=38569 RepID=A0ABD1DNW2_CULPP
MLFASRKEKVVEKDLRVCRTILDRTCGFLAGDCWAFVRRLKPRNRRELRIGGSSAATRTGRLARRISHRSKRANSEPISAIHPKGGPAGRGIKQWSLCQSRCGNLCLARPISEERRQKQDLKTSTRWQPVRVQQKEEAQHEHAHTINQNAKGPGKGAFSVGARRRLLEAGARLLARDGTSRRALGETTLGVVREGADEEQPAKLWSHVGML